MSQIKPNLIFLFFVSFWATNAFCKPDYRPGGAYLEFPIGRFLEDGAPELFRWKLTKPAQSLALKIYKADANGNYNEAKDLLGRIDLVGETETADWKQDRIPNGNYVWTIERYVDKNPKPETIDKAQFVVESVQSFDLKTHRLGLAVGFGRGSYFSEDTDFELSYSTTPTLYGITYTNDINQSNAINVRYIFSDFLLQDDLRSAWQLNLDVLFNLSPLWHRNRFMLGPSLGVHAFPRQRTTDGEVLQADNVTVVSPGIAGTIHRQFDRHIGLYTKVNLEFAAAGTVDVNFNFQLPSFQIRSGMLYTMFWPLGFAGEVFYMQSAAETMDGSDVVEVLQTDYGVMTNLLYAF